MKNISLSVFFPAFNESQNIETTVRSAIMTLDTLVTRYEIIIVNDGSSDETAALADTLASTFPHVRAVHHAENQGYGAAVWSGIQAAQYDWVFFTDADLQFDLKDLEKLLQFIPEYMVVLGYRKKRQDPFFRLLNAKGWNILNRLLFGLTIRDVDCAFKLFSRDLVASLPIRSRGAMMSAELLIRLQRQGVPFKEVPVTHLPRKRGSPTGAKPSVILRAFKELIIAYRGDLSHVTHRQALKFMAVGIGNTCFDLIVYFLLTRYVPFFSFNQVLAKISSYGMASIVSFILNRRWTFRRTSRVRLAEILRFYLTVGLALLINAGTMYVLITHFKIRDIIAAPAATLVSFLFNFLVSKFWVFTHKKG